MQPESTVEEQDDGPKAHVELVSLWRFVLGKRDALLVLKALGGRLTDAEQEQARELCDRLTLLREKGGLDLIGGLTRAADAVRAKGDSK